MPIQIPRLRESQQAQLTLVGFLAGVNAEMFSQSGGVAEKGNFLVSNIR